MKVQRLFFITALVGMVTIFTTLVLLLPHDSPYRYGKLAGLWWLVQFASGVLLVYAGMMGGVMAVNDADHLRGSRPWVGIASLVVVIGFVSMTVVMACLSDAVTVLATPIDKVAVGVGAFMACYAVLAGGLALYYVIWAHRFLKRGE